MQTETETMYLATHIHLDISIQVFRLEFHLKPNHTTSVPQYIGTQTWLCKLLSET